MSQIPPNASNQYMPRVTQSAPPYGSNLMPDNAERMDCTFDDTAAWNAPLERLPVDMPPLLAPLIGDNPYAQKRRTQDPQLLESKKRHTFLKAVYITVITLCVLAIAGIGILMMPQIAGYFWKDMDNFAFINGELLRYDSETNLSYKRYRDYLSRNVIYPGVFIDDIHVGDLSPSDALTQLGDSESASPAFSLTINIGNKSWSLGSQNISAQRDLNKALLKAYAYGRQNTTEIIGTQRTPFRQRVDTVLDLREHYASIQSKQTFDYASIQSVIDEINAYVTRKPLDAQIQSFDFNTRTFTFSDDQPGIAIDAAALYQQVTGLLEQGVTNQSITVTPTLTMPAVTKQDLQNTFKLIAAFSTKTSSDSNRNNNISIACQSINGTVLLPGDTFSFNATVGERTIGRGYREAGAIASGQLIDEVGGGICQVSSTLFNAVVRANLEIVSRSPHAWPSTYVNKGEDATVNWPNLDFKFKNNTDTPVFLITYYKDRQCTAEIWGKTLGDNVTIDLASTTVKTIDPPVEILYVQNPQLPVGTSKETVKLRTGYVVETYKVWYRNGTEFQREFLHKSTYKAYQRTIEYN